MDFKEYQQLAARTDNDSVPTALHILGLCGESGEVAELFKKNLGHGHSLSLDKLEKELGDVLWYLSAIATRNELSLEAIAARNVRKLESRYPEGFDTERSINREVDHES